MNNQLYGCDRQREHEKSICGRMLLFTYGALSQPSQATKVPSARGGRGKDVASTRYN